MLNFLHVIFVMLLLLAAAAATALASDDAEHEGQFNNRGSTPLYCYKDVYPGGKWTICSFRVAPGASCRGDAIGTQPKGPVFKIPNRTEFNCSSPTPTATAVSCGAANRTSALLIRVAKLAHKNRGYEAMGWDDFYKLMTGDQTPPVQDCDQNWVPLPQAACPT